MQSYFHLMHYNLCLLFVISLMQISPLYWIITVETPIHNLPIHHFSTVNRIN